MATTNENRILGRAFLALIAFVLTIPQCAHVQNPNGGIIYVNAAAPVGGNGSSWANATKELADALIAAAKKQQHHPNMGCRRHIQTQIYSRRLPLLHINLPHHPWRARQRLYTCPQCKDLRRI